MVSVGEGSEGLELVLGLQCVLDGVHGGCDGRSAFLPVFFRPDREF